MILMFLAFGFPEGCGLPSNHRVNKIIGMMLLGLLTILLWTSVSKVCFCSLEKEKCCGPCSSIYGSMHSQYLGSFYAEEFHDQLGKILLQP